MALLTGINHYYKLDDVSGNATDEVGSEDLTVTGSPHGGTGKLNDAFTFNGSSEQATHADHASFDIFDGDWTIAFWVKTSATAGTIFRKRSGGGGADGIQIGTNVGGTLNFTVSVNGNNNVVTSAINDDAWRFIVFLRSGSSCECYINGMASSSLDCSQSVSGDGNNDQSFFLGSEGGGDYWAGTIDGFGVWDKALSEAERVELYNSGTGLDHPFSAGSDWTGKIGGVTNPAKVNGVAVGNINTINGV